MAYGKFVVQEEIDSSIWA